MEYVGWRDVHSALRYVEADAPFGDWGVTRLTISYCATAYVITAAQSSQFSLEVSDSTGVRNQDSQT
jgi:hypothetical protein